MASINKVLAKYDMNLSGQYLATDASVGDVIIEADKEYMNEVLMNLKNIEHPIKFRVLY